MATYSAYPTTADLTGYLRGAGILPKDGDEPSEAEGLQYQLALDAAIEEWEAGTGYKPFLADSDATERRIYASRWTPTTEWSLDGGIIPGTVTLVRLYPDLDPDTLNPDILDSDSYAFLPVDALSKSIPFNRMRLPLRARTGYLAITARWGYADTLPADVFQAILFLATLSLADPARNLMLSAGGGAIEEIERSELRVKFGNSASDRQRLMDGWKGQAGRTMRRYSRLGIR